MPEDQDSFQCSIIEIQMSKLSPKIQQESSCIFPQGIFFLWLQSSDLGTREEVVTCDYWPFEICASNALFHMPHDTFCALVLLFAKQNSRPFWPQTPVLWEKVVKTFNIWGSESRIQVCVSNSRLWFNPWSMQWPNPKTGLTISPFLNIWLW
jgi:hypothetical protein